MTEQTKFKWTEEATAILKNAAQAVGGEVPYATVESLAEEIGTSTRSVAAKLRSLDFDVEHKAAKASVFSVEDTTILKDFVEANAGKYDIHELAAKFLNGKFTNKQLQGKILSLELSSCLKPAPKKEAVSKYSADQEATIASMVAGGSFIEDIAEALGAEVRSIRGKLLSMLRKEQITAIPKSKNPPKDTNVDPFAGIDVTEMTVAEIAAAVNKTERGVKAMLTRRQINAKDYTAKSKAEAE